MTLIQARACYALSRQPGGGIVQLHASKGARVLVLAGEPIDEPVVAYGPFGGTAGLYGANTEALGNEGL